MITAEQYKQALGIVKDYRQQCIDTIKEIDSISDNHSEFKETLIIDSYLSQRVINVLCGLGLNRYQSKIKEIADISYNDYVNTRNIGRRSRIEIDKFCSAYNITMKK